MSQIKLNLYCIVTRKLKSYVKDFITNSSL